MPSTLSIGSSGGEVRELQNQLNTLGYGSYLGSAGVDGLFGEATQRAVAAFQSSAGIKEQASSGSPKVGDKVTFLGGPVYVSSDAKKPSANRKRALCKVTLKSTASWSIHPIHLVHEPGQDKVYGWVDTANIESGGAICGPKTWEALRKALNPDPPKPEPEFEKVPPYEPEIPISYASDSGLFIMNLVTGTQIDIPCRPDEVSDTISVVFEGETPRGRSVGYTGYTATENRMVSVVVRLHSDVVRGSLESVVNKFKALEYPNYEVGMVIPPNCYVNLYRGIRMTALCTQCDVLWHGDIKESSYTHADVSLMFRNTVDIPYTADYVEGSGPGM